MFRFLKRDRSTDTASPSGEVRDRTLEVLATLDEEMVMDLAVDAYWNMLQRFFSPEQKGSVGDHSAVALGAFAQL